MKIKHVPSPPLQPFIFVHVHHPALVWVVWSAQTAGCLWASVISLENHRKSLPARQKKGFSLGNIGISWDVTNKNAQKWEPQCNRFPLEIHHNILGESSPCPGKKSGWWFQGSMRIMIPKDGGGINNQTKKQKPNRCTILLRHHLSHLYLYDFMYVYIYIYVYCMYICIYT